MDLKSLETFLKVSQSENFTKTAEELNYAQSNVSAQVRKLEQELGCALFDRTNHRVSLTKKGKELVPYAQQILCLAASAKEQLADCTRGKLMIAASESLCIYELPKNIQRFQSRYPNLEIVLSVTDTDQYEKLLADTDTDLAYVLDLPVESPMLKTYCVHTVDVCLFAAPAHPLAGRKNLTVKDLANTRFLLTKPGCCYRRQFEAKMAGIPYQTVMETSSLQAIKEMALNGLGCCLLPEMAVARELQDGKLVRLAVDLNIKVYSQVLIYRDKWMQPDTKLFLDVMKEQNIT